MVDFTVTIRDEEDSSLSQEQINLIAEYTLIAANFWGRYIDALGVTLEIELTLTTDIALAGARSFSAGVIGIQDDGTELLNIQSIVELQTGRDVSRFDPDILISLNPERFDDFFFDPNPNERNGDFGFRTDFISLLIHEIGHGLGFTGAGSGRPLRDLPNLTRQFVFDTFLEEIDGVVVFTGSNAFAVAGRNIELSGITNADGELIAQYHIGNFESNLSPLAGLGSDLSPSVLNGLGLFGEIVYFPTAIDVAILTDLGVPIRKTTDGDDELYGFEVPDPDLALIFETPSAEFLNGYDTIVGGDGDDTLFGLSGNDLLRGDAGNDHVIAGRGNDSVFAGADDDGNDTLEGGLGDDVLGGGAGDDIIIGGEQGTDGLSTRDENMGAGSDTLFGGAGNDLLVAGSYDSDTGQAVMTGPVTESLPFIITDRNVLYAGIGDDVVIGDNGADILGGGTGSDSIAGNAGNDTLYGGAGSGADTLLGGSGDDEIFAGGGADSIDGGAGNDLIFNGGGNDVVSGGAGNDTLWGSGGDDMLTGGAGADTFAFAANNGEDTVSDFDTSEDILDLSEFNLASFAALQASISQDGTNSIITLSDTTIILSGVNVADITEDTVII